MSSIRVKFPNGLVLANDFFGEGLSLSTIDNWWDSTDPRLQNEARPTADGDFGETDVTYEPLYPVVIGRATYPSNPDQVFDARRIVFDLYTLGDTFPVEVTDPHGTYTAEVRIAGKIRWDLRIGPGIAQFEIPLKAEDPLKYGPRQTLVTGLPTSGGGVTEPLTEPLSEGVPGRLGRVVVTNSGNAPTLVRFTVTGGLSGGFEIIHVERALRIRVERQILQGSVVEVDQGSGQVWLDGQSPISGDLVISDWWALQPGETATIQFVGLGMPTGDPTLTAIFASAER